MKPIDLCQDFPTNHWILPDLKKLFMNFSEIDFILVMFKKYGPIYPGERAN